MRALSHTVLVLLLASPAAALYDDALLDEVVAGIDANLALINHGTAAYDRTRWRYVDDTRQDSEEFTTRVVFLDDMVRWQDDEWWNLWDEKNSYQFEPPIPSDPPYKTNIKKRFRELAKFWPWRVHPRTLGHGVQRNSQDDRFDEMRSLADQVRFIRGTGENEWKEIVAEREGDKIKVTFRYRPEKLADAYPGASEYKDEYWVDPNQGYGVVRQRKSGRKEWPYFEADVRYVETDNGAWIADHYSERTWQPGRNGGRVGSQEILVELEDVDLTAPVAPDEFTLAAMGVPKGARINDTNENRMYFYQVAAVTEEEIDKEWDRQREEHWAAIRAERRWRRQLVIYSIVGGIALLVGGVIFYRCRSS